MVNYVLILEIVLTVEIFERALFLSPEHFVDQKGSFNKTFV